MMLRRRTFVLLFVSCLLLPAAPARAAALLGVNSGAPTFRDLALTGTDVRGVMAAAHHDTLANSDGSGADGRVGSSNGTPAAGRMSVGDKGDAETGGQDTSFPVNVLTYGADRTGVGDSTAAFRQAVNNCVTAGGCVFYVPRGKYKTAGGFVFNVPVTLRGDGATNGSIPSTYASRVEVNSPTANGFTFSGLNWKVEDILIVNTSAARPTAGAGLVATHPSANYARGVYENVWVEGFYDCVDSQVGGNWSMHATVIQDPVRHGIRIRNTVTTDTGDWSISNTSIVASTRLADSAISNESSGGGKIVNLKVNGTTGSGAPGTGSFLYGFHAPIAGTSIIQISNSSIENVRGQGVRIVGPASGFAYVNLVNVEIALYGAADASDYAMYLENVRDSTIDNIIAVGDGAGPPAVLLKNCARMKIGTIHATGFNPYVLFDTAYTETGYTYNNGWNNVTFQNAWVNHEGGYATCQYALQNGVVHVKCAAKNGAVGRVMFTLPLGYRPAADFYWPTYEAGATRHVLFKSDGTVTHSGAANGNVIFYATFIPR